MEWKDNLATLGKLAFILITIIAIFIIGGMFYVVLFKNPTASTTERQIVTNYVYLNRATINDEISKLINAGYTDQLLAFYDKETKSRQVSTDILTNARNCHIPVNLFFALSFSESRYNPWAENGHKNQDDSHDWGLFQLNSKNYSKYGKTYLFDSTNNARLAAIHLADIYYKLPEDKKYWEKAICIYNAGTRNRIPNTTIDHLGSILDKEQELDQAFSRMLRSVKLMSWHYLQGQEVVSLEESYLDGTPFAPSKLKTTQDKCCCKDKEMESCQGSQYGMILALLMESSGLESLILLPGGYLVKTFKQQEKDKGLLESDLVYGKKCQGWFAKYDQDSYSWKTPQCSLVAALAFIILSEGLI